MLKKFHEVFEKDFLNHLAFIITRWSYNSRDITERLNDDVSEEKKT
jgi:hypothetical protein